MPNLYCAHCHHPLGVSLSPEPDSVSPFVPTGKPPKPERSSWGPGPAAESAKHNTAAVHNWLQLGGPGGDGPSRLPVWGETFTAKDTYWRYMSWAVFHGVRWLTARSFSQALRRFGVVPGRTGQGRYYSFPPVKPAVLEEQVPCPRLSDPQVLRMKLPWIRMEEEHGLLDPARAANARLIELRKGGEIRELDHLGQPAVYEWIVRSGPEFVFPVADPAPEEEAGKGLVPEPEPEVAVSEPVAEPMAREWAEDVPVAEPAAEPVDPEYAEEAADSAPSSSWPPPRWSERYAERPLVKPTPFAAGARDGQPTSE